MKAVSNKQFDVLRVTPDVIDEIDQDSIREFVPGIVSIEKYASHLVVSTREQRISVFEGNWIVKKYEKGKAKITALEDWEFNKDYQLVKNAE